MRLDLHRQKSISLLITIKISLNIQIDISVYRSNFKTTNFASFSSKKLNYAVIKFTYRDCQPKLSQKITTTTKTDFTLLASVEKFRAITMCSTLTFDWRYDNINSIFCENVHYSKEMCSGKLCVHKKTFQSLRTSDYQCLQCTSWCQVRNIPLEEQTNSVFLKCDSGLHFLKRHKNQYNFFWKILLSWKVLFKTTVCLFPYNERERWKLFRKFVKRRVLLRFEHSL